MTNDSLMKVESIAEYFWPALSGTWSCVWCLLAYLCKMYYNKKIILASFLWDIQCMQKVQVQIRHHRRRRLISTSTVCSNAYSKFYKSLNKNENYHSTNGLVQSIKWEIPFGLDELIWRLKCIRVCVASYSRLLAKDIAPSDPNNDDFTCKNAFM